MSLRLFAKTAPWYYLEQFFRSLSTLVAAIYVAKYLEPEKFGLLSYAILFTTIFSGVSRLGMDVVLIKKLGDEASISKKGEIVSTAFFLMLGSSLLCIVLIFALVYALHGWTGTLFFTTLVSLSMFFQPFQVIDYWFKSEQAPHRSAIPLIAAHLTNASLKVALVIAQAPFIFFIFAYTLEFIIAAIFLAYTAGRNRSSLAISRPTWGRAKDLLEISAPLVLSTVAIVLYMRIDQLFIAKMLGAHELGLYSAATRLYEASVMMFAIFASVLLPILVRLRASDRELYQFTLQRVFRVGFWIGAVAGALVFLTAQPVVSFLFGEAYENSAAVLSVLALSLSFTAFGSLTAKYLILEGQARKIVIRTFVALVINISLNLVLIPKYGMLGAAYATLVCLIFSNFLIDYLDSDLSELAIIKTRTVFWIKPKL